jgi:hypothetical protein
MGTASQHPPPGQRRIGDDLETEAGRAWCTATPGRAVATHIVELAFSQHLWDDPSEWYASGGLDVPHQSERDTSPR